MKDLSNGKSPDEFYTCLIEDRFGVEAWRASPQCFDYTIPSSSWCALTCLHMLLRLHDRPAPSLETLFADACAAGVYRWKKDVNGKGEGWHGSYYAELASFLSNYGFEAEYRESLTVKHLVRALDQGQFVLPSVSPDIRFPLRTEEPGRRGGHVVLVYGYARGEDGLSAFKIQNAAGFATENSQIGVSIPESRMQQVFGGRATFVRPSW